MKKTKQYYVIADGGRARLVMRDEEGAFRTLSSFVSSNLHKSSHELGLDRPARVNESASPTRHAVEPRHDLHEAIKEEFIRTLAADLGALHKQGEFDALVLVAPPGVLTELKQALSGETAKTVVGELQKDLTKVPDHDLTSHLAK